MTLSGKHSVPGFDKSLEELRSDILMMATLVRRNMSNARTGFVERDDDYCAGVIADDEEVDLLEKQIDRGGTHVLISFQPLAFDFRTVLATIKLGSQLENISDQIVNIARRTRGLIEQSRVEDDNGLVLIFEEVDKSLNEALDAFSSFDNSRAEKLRGNMKPLAERAQDFMEGLSDAVGGHPERSGYFVNLIMIARSLEQIAYLIETITEDITYVAEAEDVRHADNRLAVESEE
jgi:phosphate transport system protein